MFKSSKIKSNKVSNINKNIYSSSKSKVQTSNNSKPKTKITINKALLWKNSSKDFSNNESSFNNYPKQKELLNNLPEQKNINKKTLGHRKIFSFDSNLEKRFSINTIDSSSSHLTPTTISSSQKDINTPSQTDIEKMVLNSRNKHGLSNYKFFLHHASKNLNNTFSQIFNMNNSFNTNDDFSFNNNLNLSKINNTNNFENEKENIKYNKRTYSKPTIQEMKKMGINFNLSSNKPRLSQSNIFKKEISQYKTKINFDKSKNFSSNKINNNNTINKKNILEIKEKKISNINPIKKSIIINEKKNNNLNISFTEKNTHPYHKRIFSNDTFNSTFNLNETFQQENTYNNDNNKTKYEKDIKLLKKNKIDGDNEKNPFINLEILIILENKLKDILNKLNHSLPAFNEIFEYINYFFESSLNENLEYLFLDSNNRKLVKNFIKTELLCYCIGYDISYEPSLNKILIVLKTIFELIHFNFLVIIKFILSKTKMNNINYMWYEKLYNLIKKSMSMNLNKNDLNEHNILQIIFHNIKGINDYYVMIIDNIYSIYYKPDIRKFKFPNSINIDLSKEIYNKAQYISSFFFDAFYKKDLYKIEDIKLFFDKFIFRIPDKNNSYILSYNIHYNTINKPEFLSSNKMYSKICYLPKINYNKYKYTLVLDLDETLAHVTNQNNKNKIILRPYLHEFLRTMKHYYELVLFSFGTKEYVDPIVNIIEKNEKFFEYKLYRQHATLYKNEFIKDLSKLGRDLNRVIIVDNLRRVFKLQKENGICIKSFYGDTEEDGTILKDLTNILEDIRYDLDDTDDVRISINKKEQEIISKITSNFQIL